MGIIFISLFIVDFQHLYRLADDPVCGLLLLHEDVEHPLGHLVRVAAKQLLPPVLQHLQHQVNQNLNGSPE